MESVENIEFPIHPQQFYETVRTGFDKILRSILAECSEFVS